MDLGEIGWGAVDWNGLFQERDNWEALLNTAMKLRSVKRWESITWLYNWWPLE
jgi:hypothetical protein